MSDKIVPFTPKVKPPEPEPDSEGGYVFVCCDCSCRTWVICDDGSVECANCRMSIPPSEGEHINGDWRKTLPKVDRTSEVTDGGCIDIKNLGTIEMARKKVMRDIIKVEKAGEATILFAVNKNGASHMWAEAETEEQKEYVIGKLQDYINHFKNKHIEEKEPEGEQSS